LIFELLVLLPKLSDLNLQLLGAASASLGATLVQLYVLKCPAELSDTAVVVLELVIAALL